MLLLQRENALDFREHILGFLSGWVIHANCSVLIGAAPDSGGIGWLHYGRITRFVKCSPMLWRRPGMRVATQSAQEALRQAGSEVVDDDVADQENGNPECCAANRPGPGKDTRPRFAFGRCEMPPRYLTQLLEN